MYWTLVALLDRNLRFFLTAPLAGVSGRGQARPSEQQNPLSRASRPNV